MLCEIIKEKNTEFINCEFLQKIKEIENFYDNINEANRLKIANIKRIRKIIEM